MTADGISQSQISGRFFQMSAINKDIGAGALFIAIGLFFAGRAWFGLSIGISLNMGPGYFPFLLGILLAGIGLVVGMNGLRSDRELADRIPLRGGALVIGSIFFFAFTVRGLGIAPALVGSALMAALAPEDTTWRMALFVSSILTVFCLTVFI